MTEQNPQSGQSEKITIPNLGEFTPEEINEWKQGYLRQSDYTKKTQELAEEKKRLQQSQQQQTPVTTQQDTSQLIEMEKQLQKLSIENELSKLKSKYSDFNEVAVLDKAIDLMNKGTPASAIDWEMIHKANVAVDADTIRREIIEKLQSGGDVSSIIGGNDNPPDTQPIKLTQDEDRIRIKMGISVEDWVKNK